MLLISGSQEGGMKALSTGHGSSETGTNKPGNKHSWKSKLLGFPLKTCSFSWDDTTVLQHDSMLLVSYLPGKLINFYFLFSKMLLSLYVNWLQDQGQSLLQNDLGSVISFLFNCANFVMRISLGFWYKLNEMCINLRTSSS
jgi:hypothetical protein